MPNFILNRNPQPTGEREVHKNDSTCNHLPEPKNRIDLGYHSTCHGAVAKAKQLHTGHPIDGCYYCANACHTR